MRETVVVLGAGPAGLAVGAMLRKQGLDPLLVDRADSVGSTWRHHYDRLHLHTARSLSHLPGLRMPRSYAPSAETRARHDSTAHRALGRGLAAGLRGP